MSCWFSAALSSATPQQYASGLPALDAFLKSDSYLMSHSEVVGMVGFYGQDQPQQWLILTRDRKSPEMLHEFVVSDLKIVAKRKMRKLPDQDLPSIVVERSRLRVDSDIVFQMVEDLARTAGIGFDSVHYKLRCRAQDHEPVWAVNLLDPAGKSVGIHYVSAETGLILRSVWNRAATSLTEIERTSDGRPVSLLYGGKVSEITISGQAPGRVREVRPVDPLAQPAVR